MWLNLVSSLLGEDQLGGLIALLIVQTEIKFLRKQNEDQNLLASKTRKQEKFINQNQYVIRIRNILNEITQSYEG